MAAGSKSHFIQNPREMIVSTDLTRIGKLAVREQQDADQAKSVRADFYTSASGTIDDFGPANRATAATPISGALVAPSLTGSPGTLNMLIGAGEVEFASSDTSVPDVSAYQTTRWTGQIVTWPTAANPDANYPKIATICVTPGDDGFDVASRNILLNPTTRQFEPQNVPKTSDPTGTISVVAGTAATTPFPPAVPSGAVALFDVLMHAGDTQSLSFCITRRCWRRIEFPGSSQHGILKDCVPTWAYGAESAGSTTKLVTASRVHRAIIDGELLTFSGTGYITPVTDTVNGPTSAPAGNDMATYLYLCGGRNWPYALLTNGGLSAVPVVLVESLTAPDAMGHPSAALAWAGSAIPRAAALFIGCAFRIANTSLTKSVFYDGDWVRPQDSTSGPAFLGFYLATITTIADGYPVTTLDLSGGGGGIPAVSTALELQADYNPGAAGAYQVGVRITYPSSGPVILRPTMQGLNGGIDSIGEVVSPPARIPCSAGAATVGYQGFGNSPTTGIALHIRPTAYNMNIPRVGK